MVSICQYSCKELFNFDASNGEISHVIPFLCENGGYGTSFSPDNSKLYFCGQLGIAQYDLSSNDSLKIIKSETIVAIKNEMFNPYKFGTLQLGPDRKIYISTFTHWLGRLDYPDSPGVKCHFDSNAVNLGDGISYFGLPNFMDSYTDTSGYEKQGLYCEPVHEFDILPNPASSVATARMYFPFSDITLDLYDILGKKIKNVFSGKLSLEAQDIFIQTSDIATGEYYIRLKYPGGVMTKKLIVTH